MKEDLKKKLEECQKQRDEYLAGWQRAKADFINHKKEEMERMERIMRYAEEEMVLKIIPILDNFELTEKNLSEEDKKDDKIKGILQIKNQIQNLLKTSFVEEINTKGAKFDPNFHEAIEMVESKEKSGTILEELQKGYLMDGKLIRPSKVKVAK
ncbi:MAG: nucleotide exchange factor GrpE [bacterium]